MIESVVAQIEQRALDVQRLFVAIAGPPGSGKSTFAEKLNQALGPSSAIMPMDGFHLDNAILSERGLLDRKGCAASFDAAGLLSFLIRMRNPQQTVYVPLFDRKVDLSRAGARAITPEHQIILVEGNYLLLDQSEWRDIAACFDVTVSLEVSEDILQARLMARWTQLGFTPAAAEKKVAANDLINARVVLENSLAADIRVASAQPIEHVLRHTS